LVALLAGFITTSFTIVILMIILWPTINTQALIDVNNTLTQSHGFGGHLWVILLMLLVVNLFIPFKFTIPTPIEFMKINNINNSFGNFGLYALILFVWFVGCFAGGMLTRGGMWTGSKSATLSYLFLDLLFSAITASILSGFGGISGFALFLATFFFSIFIGSFLFVGIIGAIGGALGGIVGKLVLTNEKIPTKGQTEL